MMDEFLSRTALMLGDNAVKKLQESRVAVFGVGGVGGYAVEALCRAGIGSLDIVDSDTVAPSNLNRQIIATRDTVGQYKVDAAEARIKSINPDCKVTKHRCFFLPETVGEFDFASYDYVVDAIDTVTGKLELIRCAKEAGVPVISSMGAGNKLDPTAFRVADIEKTRVCPLARIMRKELKKRGISGVKCVFSEEIPMDIPQPERESGEAKRVTPGSVSFVPSVVGLIIAAEVVKDLTGVRNENYG
ncbi:MAG: tRNA threonylcarbamoyladenosine dehydratase [Oscillospiraceae bacterium]|nr:tRNA threonylcarbamoyladenosine dehydratase [Oscillospiraceae bacterium]